MIFKLKAEKFEIEDVLKNTNKEKPKRKFFYYRVCYRSAGWDEESEIIARATSPLNACYQIEKWVDDYYGRYQERDIYCAKEYDTKHDARLDINGRPCTCRTSYT